MLLYIIIVLFFRSKIINGGARFLNTLRLAKPTKTVLYAIPPEVIDRSYNLAAGSAAVGTLCGVLENFKGPTAKLFGGGGFLFIS